MRTLNQPIFIIYYALIFVLHIYAINGLYQLMGPYFFPNSFFFITNISTYCNFINYTIRFLTQLHFLPQSIINSKFMKIYFQIAYSVSFIVFALFWGMYLSNPLLWTKNGFKIDPKLNIVLHGGNYIFNMIEHTFVNPGTTNKSVNAILYFIITTIYFTFIYLLNKWKGIVVYGFLTDDIITIAIVVVCGGSLVLIGDWVYRLTAKDEVKKKVEKIF